MVGRYRDYPTQAVPVAIWWTCRVLPQAHCTWLRLHILSHRRVPRPPLVPLLAAAFLSAAAYRIAAACLFLNDGGQPYEDVRRTASVPIRLAFCRWKPRYGRIAKSASIPDSHAAVRRMLFSWPVSSASIS